MSGRLASINNKIDGLASNKQNAIADRDRKISQLQTTKTKEEKLKDQVAENQKTISEIRSSTNQQIASIDKEISTLKSEIPKAEKEAEKEKKETKENKLGESYGRTKEDGSRGFAGILEDKAKEAEARGDMKEAERLRKCADKWEKKGENLSEKANDNPKVAEKRRKAEELKNKVRQKEEQKQNAIKGSDSQIVRLSNENKSVSSEIDGISKSKEKLSSDIVSDSSNIDSIDSNLNKELDSEFASLTSKTSSRNDEFDKQITNDKQSFMSNTYKRDREKTIQGGLSDKDIEASSSKQKEKYLNEVAEKAGMSRDELNDFLKGRNVCYVASFVSKNAEGNLKAIDQINETSDAVADHEKSSLTNKRKESQGRLGEYEGNMDESSQNVSKLYGGKEKLAKSYNELKEAYTRYKTTGSSEGLADLTAKMKSHANLLSDSEGGGMYNFDPVIPDKNDKRFNFLAFNDKNINRFEKERMEGIQLNGDFL